MSTANLNVLINKLSLEKLGAVLALTTAGGKSMTAADVSIFQSNGAYGICDGRLHGEGR